MTLNEKINLIIRDVAELPDRTSPEDFPDALIVTSDELEEILIQNFADSFEYIQKAAQEIWYDNGMINQFEPLGIKLDYLKRWLVQQDELELIKIESELASLSEEDLFTVCCGEESEQYRLASKELNEFLCRIFDEEYLVKEQSHD
ncbi:hypothetical protein [Acinetobacter bereziniae]|uniref:hypothetical protein n=1 Tax=Acinetobacter bereziniae TaxID=106648 RepID=UPI0029539A83|nr:hypothetical protein [Acinetobacter bereziniae]MDV8155240.1 hypothetical protein [Acinetobacter bereziniae]